jgi:flagellar hook assembly protein FlgD
MVYVSRPERLEVTVLDINGRVVLDRSLGERTVGNHRWTWDLRSQQGQRVPTGTYLIQFATGSGISSASRVVVR